MVATGIFIASFLTLAWGKPTAPNFVVHESLDSVPEGFVRKGAADASTSLNLRIALTSKDMAGLEKALYDVSTPSSKLYGRHLSKEEVEAFVAPTSDTTSAVKEWLTSYGLTTTPISPAGDWLNFSVDVKTANELLDANFSVFTHQSTGDQAIRTLSYSIPASLRGHVDLVHPTIFFPNQGIGLPVMKAPIQPKRNLTSDAVPASCAQVVTPACLQALYGIPSTPVIPAPNLLGVSGFINQFAQLADLNLFLTDFRPDINPANSFILETVDGGSNPQGPGLAGVEANLDIQYTVGVVTDAAVIFFSVGLGSADGFLDLVNFILSAPEPPTVLTTSYGFNEVGFPSSIAINLCNAYMQLGARGVSVIYASGDGGVSGIQSGSCSTFVPTFPSTCPFLTSVGATQGIAPEVGTSFSSGGFSNIFVQPSYQAAAVSGYLGRLGGINAGLFNPSGRAFPDVAAQGGDLAIINDGQLIGVAGTSCSSPIFASVVTLLNGELFAAGRSPLGFLNPFLYSTGASALTDILVGNNPGCGTNGFPATNGWDPVTGLGTPNYAALRAALGI